MPLLHRNTSRGGGPQENRRSLAEILNFDLSEFTGNAAVPRENRINGGDESLWQCWEQPASPEAAPSPRTLVPAACFPPPDNPAAFASYSELAMPGSWATDSDGNMAELVESFKAMGAPQPSARRARSYHTRLSCELKFESSWPPDGTFPAEGRALPRRASFSGGAAVGSGEARRAGGLLSWCGVLPARGLDPSPPGGYSAKVFLGGLPWDIGEEALMYALKEFMPVRVEWPGRDAAPRGFAYVTLESERRVRALLHASRRDHGKWVYRIASRNLRTKDVEVIPWAVADSNWVSASLGEEGGGVGGVGGVGGGSLRLEPSRTVFVGALHGVLSASALATIMNELFAGVVYAGIDTDKNKYPIGSGRVTFNNVQSYVRAVSAEYVEIRTDKFTKKIQVDPYLEDSMCSVCHLQQGPYFCRDPACFRYFCRPCWAWKHATENHKALMRNSKSVSFMPTNGNGNSNSGSNGNGGYGNGNGGYGNGNGGYGNGNGGYGNGNGGYGNGNGSCIQTSATPTSSSSGGSGSGAGDEPPPLEWLSLV